MALELDVGAAKARHPRVQASKGRQARLRISPILSFSSEILP